MGNVKGYQIDPSPEQLTPDHFHKIVTGKWRVGSLLSDNKTRWIRPNNHLISVNYFIQDFW